jgi:hypothetical protein
LIRAGEIYLVQKARAFVADYARPCLVLRISNHDATVCFFSTKLDLNIGPQVVLDAGDSDFAASGLAQTSCLINNLTPDVPLSFFEGAKRLGYANGQFKINAEDFYGAPIQ